MIDDPLLPAAAHLTGCRAFDVLRPVVAASGGELLRSRASHVHYRPRSDLVVRYRCDIRRGERTTVDTLLAATTPSGPFAGTVPVEADTADGTHLSVGVWQWPFDPVLVDLASMVTPRRAAEQLGGLVGPTPDLEVVVYRPTERAVVRAVGADRVIYVKVVPPSTTDGLVARHVALGEAGLPVPSILAVGDGWLAMQSLVGTTLRDRLKHGTAALPPPERYRELLGAIATVDLADAPPARSRLDDAPHHAAILATVVPDERDRLDEIVEQLSSAPASACRPSVVHGDLHEAQLVVDDDAITGLLDIDDAGPGDILDDIGSLLAHLRFRAMTSGDARIVAYADRIRDVIAGDHDSSEVDRHVAAVLVGLATGPFRIQQPDWESTTRQVLDLVDQHLGADTPVPPATR